MSSKTATIIDFAAYRRRRQPAAQALPMVWVPVFVVWWVPAPAAMGQSWAQ